MTPQSYVGTLCILQRSTDCKLLLSVLTHLKLIFYVISVFLKVNREYRMWQFYRYQFASKCLNLTYYYLIPVDTYLVLATIKVPVIQYLLQSNIYYMQKVNSDKSSLISLIFLVWEWFSARISLKAVVRVGEDYCNVTVMGCTVLVFVSSWIICKEHFKK